MFLFVITTTVFVNSLLSGSFLIKFFSLLSNHTVSSSIFVGAEREENLNYNSVAIMRSTEMTNAFSVFL